MQKRYHCYYYNILSGCNISILHAIDHPDSFPSTISDFIELPIINIVSAMMSCLRRISSLKREKTRLTKMDEGKSKE